MLQNDDTTGVVVRAPRTATFQHREANRHKRSAQRPAQSCGRCRLEPVGVLDRDCADLRYLNAAKSLIATKPMVTLEVFTRG
jgi:hypothetical protein